jgi:hypothetical protein
MSTSRQPRGTRTGGQFAAAHHSEPQIILTSQGLPASPAIHEVTRLHSGYRQEMAHLVRKMDQNCFHSTLITAKEMYPGAQELRLRSSNRGGQFSEKYEPASIRTADGTVIPADTTDPEHHNWWHKAPALAEPGSIYNAVTSISPDSEVWRDRRCEWDPSTEELVIYLDGRTSSEHQNG